ncbi:SpoIIE family protein phosphatase [Streptomyces sp. NPDC001904]|uniref:GAF domain-containing SpoIIE family protein phosphatase n=1 Tax=Streptomyces sp. NPDC001904 TaxID=3154531 RepID=UPI003333F4FD
MSGSGAAESHAPGAEPAEDRRAERVAAVHETGLSATADAGMDRFARLVAELLNVPVALVSMVTDEGQFFPGMIGLAEPWATARRTPLSHSLCRHVVADAAPFVVDDTRADPRTQDSPAIEDLGVDGYAGMPLTTADGQVLGALCAIDNRPRRWTERELRALEDLAAACSAELRLRVASRQREAARTEAGELAGRLRIALERSQLLLRAADALADTTGLAEVRQQIRDLVTSDLKPVYVGLVLVDGDDRLRRLVDATGSAPMEERFENYRLGDAWPTARAARENRTITIHDIDQLARDYGADAVAAFTSLGLSSAVCVPLPGTVIPLGTLTLGWDQAHEIDIVEQALLASLAGYTARAVERALFVDSRIEAARQMQEALLTDLPAVPGLELAALYRPASDGELVGGDWYDAYRLPAAAGDADPAEGATLAVSVGDITGHNLGAATLMGQARSMLRQADLDHADQGPARSVTAFEHANQHLGLDVSGTLVHAHLRPCPDTGTGTGTGTGTWELTYTNAGHPAPLVVGPDGTVRRLDHHGPLVFPGLPARAVRADHTLRLAPGSLLLLYTDGLVEERRGDIDTAADQAGRFLADHRHDPLPGLLDRLADHVAGPDAHDDIALLALRVTGAGPAVPLSPRPGGAAPPA